MIINMEAQICELTDLPYVMHLLYVQSLFLCE